VIGEPCYPKVLLVVYDPTIPSAGGKNLSRVFGWNNVSRLVEDFIADLRGVSFGICNYQIVDRIDIDAFPEKEDGYRYSADSYVAYWRSRSGFHSPDWADYHRILEESGAIDEIKTGRVDEVWLFAFPYGGFYESRMAGPGAFWCNAPPLPGYNELKRRFVIMGFNYERGVGEMLESYGHRVESIISHVFRDKDEQADLWKRFTRTHLSHPGQAEVGTIHFAPNSQRDYDWGNSVVVPSRCDSWFDFPELRGQPRMVNSDEWGQGDTRKHHLWWFSHLPHLQGSIGGISRNWWDYIIDPNKAM
jgi:hypothetical protein